MRPLIVALLISTTTAFAAPWCQVVLPEASPGLVQQAAAELSAFLSRLTDAEVPVTFAPAPGLPAVRLVPSAEAQELGDEEYFIEPSGDLDVTLRARTPQAILHAAYRLLREYGVGNYFDGESVPTVKPAAFLRPSIHASPAFAIRGSLPWYNFLDSPTTWDDQDFRAFADQIIRSGQNFIGFHSYDYEPFAAYEFGGQTLGGEPLMTTADRIWGTWPLKVDEFGFETGRFFPGEYWGSDEARRPGTREERIKAQKALLARGLEYASARGVKTCLGFEVTGDPTNPEEQARFRARLTQLLREYPMLDYVWLWQPEAMSLQGSAPPEMQSQGGALFRQWADAFAYAGSPARMWEGMRIAAYGRLAQQIMALAAPDVKLVLSGWGGDHHLRVSDYYPGWDKVLDKRIIFAALDDICVSPQVSKHYALPADRERWAIPWYEFDGDQWFPQANARVFEQTVRDAKQKGCQGLLAIHWRTKEVGESQALCAQYAWNPEETLTDFYRDYATRRVGEAQGPEYGAVLQELDALGYRWLGGGGQVECGEFGWCFVDDPAREATLRALRDRVAKVRAGLPDDAPSGARGRVDDTLATLDRALMFNRIAGLLVASGPVDQALALPATDPARKAKAESLLTQLTGPDFGNALNLYAQTITTRGELGVLATVNGKAFVDLTRKVARLREIAGLPTDTADLTRPDPRHRGLISDYQLSSVAAGQPLPVRCVAYSGDRPADRVVLLYQRPTDHDWIAIELYRRERCVFEGSIPADQVTTGWLRYRIIAELPDGELEWPALRGEAYRQVTVLPATSLVPRRNAVTPGPPQPPAQLTLAASADANGVRLTWPVVPGLPMTTLQRRVGEGDWQTLGQTLDWTWGDSAAPPLAEPEYRLLDAAGAQLAACRIQTPAAPAPTAPADLSVRARGPAVRLTWAGADLTVHHYSVQRAAPGEAFQTLPAAAEILPRGFSENVLVDRPRTDAPLQYRVLAHGRGDAEPALAGPVEVSASSAIPVPLINLEFDSPEITSPIGPVEWSGPHEFAQAEGAGILQTSGGVALPFGDALAVKDAFTVAIRFRQTATTPMPVLVCQGVWLGPGYFVQLMGTQLRFYVGGAGCLDRNWSAPLNTWHTLVCVYDGATLSAYADGTLLGETRAEAPFTPGNQPFTVARYCSVGPDWTFIGDVDFVRLYAEPLEPWMVMRGPTDKSAAVNLDWASADVSVFGRALQWQQTPKVVEVDGRKAADLDGGLMVPLGETQLPGETITLETSFNLRSVEAMPVLINQGVWPSEGYMLQVIGKRLRFHIGGVGSLDCGPELEPNRWYALKCTYDGRTARAWLDGEQVGELTSDLAMTLSSRPLRIGHYEADAPQYVTHGLMGPTKVGP